MGVDEDGTVGTVGTDVTCGTGVTEGAGVILTGLFWERVLLLLMLDSGVGGVRGAVCAAKFESEWLTVEGVVEIVGIVRLLMWALRIRRRAR